MGFKKVGMAVILTTILTFSQSAAVNFSEDKIVAEKKAIDKPAVVAVAPKKEIVKPVEKPVVKPTEKPKPAPKKAPTPSRGSSTARVTASGIRIDASDYELLAHLVHAEAGIDPIESQIGVVNVVLNRIKSGKFPNTIRGVIYAPNQFSVVTNGSINKTPTAVNYQAVDRAIAGQNTVGRSIFFWSTVVDKSHPIWKHGVNVQHGNTVFGGSY